MLPALLPGLKIELTQGTKKGPIALFYWPFEMVGGTWIEHVTSSVSRKRSPTELTARTPNLRSIATRGLGRQTVARGRDKALPPVLRLRFALRASLRSG